MPRQTRPAPGWWGDPVRRTRVLLGVIGVLLVALVVDLRARARRDEDAAPAPPASAPAPSDPRPRAGASAPPAPPPDAPATGPAPSAGPAARSTRAIPLLVGDDLQDAEDRAQAAGYHYIDTHDAAGRGRVQIVYGNWRVCDQDPPAGPAPRDTRIRLGVVRTGEACPAAPVPTDRPHPDRGLMPDVVGRSVNMVKSGFRGAAAVEAHDLRGHRAVLIESHWRVCAQSPPPGAPVPGRVDLGVVRFGEDCP